MFNINTLIFVHASGIGKIYSDFFLQDTTFY